MIELLDELYQEFTSNVVRELFLGVSSLVVHEASPFSGCFGHIGLDCTETSLFVVLLSNQNILLLILEY